jgi:hypothetical protein
LSWWFVILRPEAWTGVSRSPGRRAWPSWSAWGLPLARVGAGDRPRWVAAERGGGRDRVPRRRLQGALVLQRIDLRQPLSNGDMGGPNRIGRSEETKDAPKPFDTIAHCFGAMGDSHADTHQTVALGGEPGYGLLKRHQHSYTEGL